ncbi:UDP-glucoronosyl and UDP-glucosyl transferase [Dictyocaulus viviparus]|uniref:glucuronosyltransferase n=1 Tax=Dictyocaulus viviparus TaxID=29172 RepID=A0A0D8XMQ8_DICVI|nr:UDP-glucoronosyl and UDP-glucosyl transferase [Dictyocaulus viviparus]
MVMISSLLDWKCSDVKINENIKTYNLNASVGMKKEYMDDQKGKFMYEDIPIWDSRFRNRMSKVSTFLVETCRNILENKEFLEWLQVQKFDLAFSHMFDVCPIGLIHYAKIPSWIWLNSGPIMDFVAHSMGVPKVSSYVPPLMMESTDQMNFIERVKSLIGHSLSVILWKRMFADPETEYFRKLIDANFPDVVDVAKNCPLVMVNSNELYELPRPTLSKIVNIGGLGVQIKDAKPLPSEIKRIVDDSIDGLVVFSFGSVAPSHKMPLTWKNAFLDAFRKFPQYNFVMRYEENDLLDKLPSNVHIFKWLPQADLLAHEKTRVFISHGGYNSVQEAIIAGVPMITIPLFGDQLKNAKTVEKLKFTVNLKKRDVNTDKIVNALDRLLKDDSMSSMSPNYTENKLKIVSYSRNVKRLSRMVEKKPVKPEHLLVSWADMSYMSPNYTESKIKIASYSRNVKRLSRMVEKKPVKAEHLLVSWAEFVAEFKTLENLIPAGNELNFIQYHSLDVIAFLLILVTLIILTSWKFLMYIYEKMYTFLVDSQKQKKA